MTNTQHYYRATIQWTNGDRRSHVSPTLQETGSWLVSTWQDSKSPVKWANIAPVPAPTTTAPIKP
jgi:hypothetical protein